MVEFVWQVSDAKTAADAAVIDQGLGAFNAGLSVLAEVRPICCSVRLTSGRCI